MRGIKKSYLFFYVVLFITLIVLFINIFFIKNVSYLFCAIVPAVIFLIFKYLFGYEKKKKRFTYEALFNIISFTVIYILAIYIAGIFTGFSRSIYSLSLSNLLNNILPYLFVIISAEYLRSEVVRKCENSFIGYSLVTIILIVIDCTLFLTTYDLSSFDNRIKFACDILMPSISKNLFLLYICRIGGLHPTLIYRILTELKMFIIPIVPDFGLYFDSVIQTVVPAVIGFIIYMNLKQYQNVDIEGKEMQYNKLHAYSSMVITLMFVAVIVVLKSCSFVYGAIAIGSGSMTGTINKGDVVIFKQLGDYEIQNGDIMVFRKDNKMIVHRIIDVVEINNGEFVYYTKGDANQDPDGYPLTREDFIGPVKMRVMYIGIPSVELSELLKNK